MIIKPAKRLGETEEYYFSTKLKELQTLRKEGNDVINLGIGSPDLPPDNSIIETLAQEAFKPTSHGYQSYQGLPALREAISNYLKKYYQVDFNAQNEILPLMGSKEGIMHISMAFLNAEDQVLLPNPGYPTYESVSKLVSVQTIQYELNYKQNWDIDLQKLQSLPLDNIKLMWLNYPHMPTGSKANLKTLEKLISLAKKHRFLIINDNPYSQLFSGIPFSIFQVSGARDVCLELNSLSKSHNMAGWRLGWVTGNKDYIQAILKVKSNMDSGMFLPIQKAAIEALSLPLSYLQNQKEIYQKRRLIANKILKTLGCTSFESQEGMFALGKIPDHSPSAKVMADSLLQKTNVFITPGFIFGSNTERYLRISLCSSEAQLNKALKRIKKSAL